MKEEFDSMKMQLNETQEMKGAIEQEKENLLIELEKERAISTEYRERIEMSGAELQEKV